MRYLIRYRHDEWFHYRGLAVITRLNKTRLGNEWRDIGLIPFFQFLFGTGRHSINEYLSQLYEMIMDLFPDNLIMALAEGNTPQIMILACFLGFLIRNLDNRAEKLNTTMDNLYAVFLNAIEYSILVLPVFIFASLTKII